MRYCIPLKIRTIFVTMQYMIESRFSSTDRNLLYTNGTKAFKNKFGQRTSRIIETTAAQHVSPLHSLDTRSLISPR